MTVGTSTLYASELAVLAQIGLRHFPQTLFLNHETSVGEIYLFDGAATVRLFVTNNGCHCWRAEIIDIEGAEFELKSTDTLQNFYTVVSMVANNTVTVERK